MDFNVVKANVN